MEVTIYIDVLFALNFLMNLVLLFLTAMAVRIHISVPRMTAAAALMALYGVLAVLPVLSFLLSIVGKIAITIPAVLLLCRNENWRVQIKTWGIFWLISAAVGGMIVAFSFKSSHMLLFAGSLYLNVSLWTVLAGIAGVYLLISVFCRLCRQRLGRKDYIIPFSLEINGEEVYFDALLDTGCELTVPVLGDAMLLITQKEIPTMPEETFPVDIFTATGTKEISAFYPEKLRCLKKEYRICGIPAVGITEETFSKDGQYQAVFNPAMLELGGEENEKPIDRMAAKNSTLFQNTTRKGRTLYWRKRNAAAAVESGRRADVAASVEYAGATTGGAADVD